MGVSIASIVRNADQPASRVGFVGREQVEDRDVARRELILAVALILRALWRSRADEIGRLDAACVAHANAVWKKLKTYIKSVHVCIRIYHDQVDVHARAKLL